MIRHQRRYLADHQAIAFRLDSSERRKLEKFLHETGRDLKNAVMNVVVEGLDPVNSAFERGVEKGREDGYVVGYRKGSENGRLAGYEKGYKKGHSKGIRVGEDKGQRSGYERGKEEGKAYYHCERCGASLLIDEGSSLLDEMEQFLNRKRWKHQSAGECRKR